MPSKAPATVDEYLAALPKKERAALEKLRRQIKAAAPEATEAISYGMPAFKDRGRILVYYAAFKDHCSLFPGRGGFLEELGDVLKPYFSGKSTIQFTVDKPLPAGLVKKIVIARLKDNEARRQLRQ